MKKKYNLKMILDVINSVMFFINVFYASVMICLLNGMDVLPTVIFYVGIVLMCMSCGFIAYMHQNIKFICFANIIACFAINAVEHFLLKPIFPLYAMYYNFFSYFSALYGSYTFFGLFKENRPFIWTVLLWIITFFMLIS